MKCDMLRSLLITWVMGGEGGGCRCTAKLGVLHRFVTSLSRSFRRVPINHVILDGQWFNKNPRTQQLEGSKCPRNGVLGRPLDVGSRALCSRLKGRRQCCSRPPEFRTNSRMTLVHLVLRLGNPLVEPLVK